MSDNTVLAALRAHFNRIKTPDLRAAAIRIEARVWSVKPGWFDTHDSAHVERARVIIQRLARAVSA